MEFDRGLLKWSNARYWTATSIETKLNDFLSIFNTTLAKTIPIFFLNKSLNIHPGGMKILPFCVQNVGNLLKIKPLKGGIYIPPLEGNIKKLLLQPKRRAGLNSPPKSNILVMFINLFKVLTTAKIIP